MSIEIRTQNIIQYFRNILLNSPTLEGQIREMLEKGKVDEVIDMMSNRDTEVDKAIEEFYPEKHLVMHRPNKQRKDDEPYITEKLPRNRQNYINEVELFFLLGSPIIWKKTDGEDEAFSLFNDFVKENRLHSLIRRAKRAAGAETESALIFHIYREGDKRNMLPFVACRRDGYRLRTLFDQYGRLNALAYGYCLNVSGENQQHWDILTADSETFCVQTAKGWQCRTYPNPTGKINAIYFRQDVAWQGTQERINREEMLDSKVGDTNNYFADPIATATADVIMSMVDQNKPGKMIQLAGSDSKFEYVNPPQNSATRDAEKNDLADSILFDSFTPDFSVEKMKGFGTLSGTAIKNSFILGYIKRARNEEIYGEMIDRLINVIKEILKFFHPEMTRAIDSLKIDFEFAEPFADDRRSLWQAVASLYQSGVASLETAVTMLGLTDAPEEEIDRIRMAAMEAEMAKNQQQEQEQSKETEDGND